MASFSTPMRRTPSARPSARAGREGHVEREALVLHAAQHAVPHARRIAGVRERAARGWRRRGARRGPPFRRALAGDAPPPRARLSSRRVSSSTRHERRQRGEPQHRHLEHELRIDRAGRHGERLVGLEQQPEEALQVVGGALARLRRQRRRPRPRAARRGCCGRPSRAATARWRKCSSRSRQKRCAS